MYHFKTIAMVLIASIPLSASACPQHAARHHHAHHQLKQALSASHVSIFPPGGQGDLN